MTEIKIKPYLYLTQYGTEHTTTGAGYNVTPFLVVQEGVSISCKYVGSAYGAAVCFYDAGFNWISGGNITVSSDETVTLSSSNIPSGAVYYKANVVTGYQPISIFYVFDYIAGLKAPILAKSLAQIYENNIKIKPYTYLSQYGSERSTTASGYNVTPYLVVKEGDSISCKYVGSAQGAAVCFYDYCFKWISGGNIVISSNQTVQLSSSNIPDGAVYYRANVVDGYQPISTLYAFDYMANLGKLLWRGDTYKLNGKSYCSLGSSTSTMQWHSDAVANMGMEFLKFGIGGAHFYCGDDAAYNLNEVSADSPDNVIMNQVARLFNYADNNSYQPYVITLLSGLNDCYGDITNQTYEEAMAADISSYSTPQLWFDAPSSIKGKTFINLRAVIEMLSEKFPLAQLIIVTYQHVYSNSFVQSSLDHFYEVEKKIAAKYSIPVIDFYTECGWNNITASSFSDDGTHPNGSGNNLLRNFMEVKLRNTISFRKN